MQLIKLTIFKDSEVLREIKFHDGINFITNKDDEGNQIGKSTALRVLNFCLGSDGDSIWKDPDTGIENTEVKELVVSGRCEFVLDIKFESINYSIKRKIELYGKKKIRLKRLAWINDSLFDTTDKFRNALAPFLGFQFKNPNFSKIKSRFIRLDKVTASRAFRYDDKFTSDDLYTLLYSYLFNFKGKESLSEEMILDKEKNKRHARIAALLNGKSEQNYKNKIEEIDFEIDTLHKNEEEFDFKDIQNKTLEKLNICRQKISKLSSEISNIDIKIDYANKTLNSYKEKDISIDVDEIESIYNEAKTLLPNIKKSFQDVLNFHNESINKKSQFIEKQIVKNQNMKSETQFSLNILLDEEKDIIQEISNESSLAGFFIIEKELQEKNKEKGRLSYIVDEVSYENTEINKLENKIQDLRLNNVKNLEQLKDTLSNFNKYFRSTTKELFKTFSLSLNAEVDSKTNELKFSIVNQEKVSGDGAPRAASLAFDMALVEHVKSINSNLPSFTIQDYLESTDLDKLETLALRANKDKTQVIMSVLNDKLQLLDPDFIEKNTVLSLEKSDKFFKVK